MADWIFGESWSVGSASLDLRDYSVPKDDPIHNAPNTAALEAAILNKIARSHVVIIPTGLYATHSRWIHREIKGANKHAKPILAVTPWGQERESDIVTSSAAATVGWNSESIVNRIWRLYYERNP